jgi:hypothetical protein
MIARGLLWLISCFSSSLSLVDRCQSDYWAGEKQKTGAWVLGNVGKTKQIIALRNFNNISLQN